MTASPRIQRWGVILRGYEYHIEYKPGSEHQNADCLSRLPLRETVPIEDDCMVLTLKNIEEHKLLTADEIAEWTKRDPIISNVYDFILRGWPNGENDPKFAAYRVRKEELSVQGGVVLWGSRVVIPPQGRDYVLRELHSGHPGVSRMKALARSYLWYPGLHKDIKKNCVYL